MKVICSKGVEKPWSRIRMQCYSPSLILEVMKSYHETSLAFDNRCNDLSSRNPDDRRNLPILSWLLKQTPQAPSNSATYPPQASHPSFASPPRPHQHPSKP